MTRKYEYPKGIRKTSQQYSYYRWRFPGDVLFFQVGRFFEFYHIPDQEAARVPGLSEMRRSSRGARYGFPVELADRFCQRLLHRDMPVTLILETERYWTGIKERAPAWRIETLREGVHMRSTQ